MKSWLLTGLGVLIFLAGAVWALQGLGYIGGSVMTGVTFWAVAGPVVAVIGIVMVVAGQAARRSSR